jgi:hypothetical protein
VYPQTPAFIAACFGSMFFKYSPVANSAVLPAGFLRRERFLLGGHGRAAE